MGPAGDQPNDRVPRRIDPGRARWAPAPDDGISPDRTWLGIQFSIRHFSGRPPSRRTSIRAELPPGVPPEPAAFAPARLVEWSRPNGGLDDARLPNGRLA